MSQKVITRYVPAGMNIGSSINKSRKKKMKLIKDNLGLREADGNSSTKESDASEWFNHNFSESQSPSENSSGQSQKNLAPPTIICKNKSIILDDDDFKGAENSVMEQQSVTKEISITKQNETTKDNLKTEMNFKSKLLQRIKKHKESEPSCSKSDSKTENEVKETNCADLTCNEHGNENGKGTNTVSYYKERHSFEAIDEANKSLVNNQTLCMKDCSETPPKKNLPFLNTSDIGKPVKITRIYNNHLIIHGPIIPKPVHSLEETCFHEVVIEALETMEWTYPKKLQSYTWPAIQRGLNVIMVGPHESGKKLAYMPALTTFALQIPEKYMDSTKYRGPYIIILCSDGNKCCNIYTLINNLVKESWASLKIEMLTNTPLEDNCDILVAVLSDLEECLKSQTILLNRLCHLVLEDANILFKSNPQTMEKFLKMIDEMQKTRSLNKNIQIIVSSEKWTADLETLMKKLYVPPVIYFDDFFEAALYSNISFTKKKLSVAHKRFHLEDVLKQKYCVHKSVVFCSEDEISEVKEYLEMKGIECIAISNDLIEDEVFENEDMWCSLTVGRYKVLLCTDELFKKTVHSFDANWLIHYSLPSDWKTFQNRFRCLAANIKSVLVNEEDDSDFYENCTFVFTTGDKKCSNDIFNDLFNELVTSQIHSLKL